MSKNYFNALEGNLKDDKVKYYKIIDWNTLEDSLDKATYEKLISQMWVATRVPVSNDRADWRKLDKVEKDAINKAFVTLTLLDTLQSEDGAVVMLPDARTQHEKATLAYIHFNEAEHARSYSTIFTSLNTTSEIDEIFEWGNTNDLVQYKAERINEIYQNGTPLQKKVASVFLESFLFYSSFYGILHYRGNNKLNNTAEIISLILRDESVHGTFLGYKHMLGYNELSKEEQEEHLEWTHNLLEDLMENEEKYTKEIYTPLGWTQEVLTFARYNANKALQNLGFEPYYEDGVAENVNPIVMNGISTETVNFDFFSAVGNGYLLGEAEAMEEDDYDF